MEAPRSYIFNGFNDYFQMLATNNSTMPESAINEPTDTILFGEKESNSGHWWMDYWGSASSSAYSLTWYIRGPKGVPWH